jgi:hypothetical protein
MAEEHGTWADYSKLVLKELERLNDNYDRMRSDMDSRFSQLNGKITQIGSIENNVNSTNKWVERVNDVWSPVQMKEAKDEIYRQKNRWAAAIAIITFVQISIGIVLAVWSKM